VCVCVCCRVECFEPLLTLTLLSATLILSQLLTGVLFHIYIYTHTNIFACKYFFECYDDIEPVADRYLSSHVYVFVYIYIHTYMYIYVQTYMYMYLFF